MGSGRPLPPGGREAPVTPLRPLRDALLALSVGPATLAALAWTCHWLHEAGETDALAGVAVGFAAGQLVEFAIRRGERAMEGREKSQKK